MERRITVNAPTCERCQSALIPSDGGEICPTCLLRSVLDSDPKGDDATDPQILIDAEDPPLTGQPLIDRGSPHADVGPFRLHREVGRGGAGIVYEATDTTTGERVALKLLRFWKFAPRGLLERFRREAEIASRLRHPAIVRVRASDEHEGQPYLVMDWVEGQNLADWTRDHRPSPRQAAEMIRDVASALHVAHSQQVIHRDLKPSNILIDGNGSALLTDFGVAALIDSQSELTLSGAPIGSPPFSPPEQVAGHRAAIGPASDIYSLGAVLYFILAGRPPFQSDDLKALFRLVLVAEPVHLRALDPAIPRDLATICLKCLSKSPKARYHSAQDFADDLDRFLNGTRIYARAPSPLSRLIGWSIRQPGYATLSGLLLAFLLFSSFGGVALWRTAEAARSLAEHHSTQLEATVRSLKLQQANDDLTADAIPSAVAHWAALARANPNDPVAVGRLIDWLRRGNVSIPIGAPFTFNSAVSAVAFAPGNDWALVSSYDGTLVALETVTGEPRFEPVGISAPISCMSVDPTGRRVAIGGKDFSVRVYALSSEGFVLESELAGRHLDLLDRANDGGEDTGILSLAWQPDGRVLAIGDSHGRVGLWEPGGHAQPTVELGHPRGAALEPRERPTGRSPDAAPARLE